MRHLRQHFFEQRHGGRAIGPFGREFLGDDMDGRAFGMGRKLASADLRLLIVGLLAGKSRHGYEIIKALEEHSKGYYIPSPGMVYPALTYLEEIGHATVEVDGCRKLHHITATGKEYLDDNRSKADALFAQFSRAGERMERVRRALSAAQTSKGSDAERRGSKDLLRARRDLESALADKWGASPDEQQRVREILTRAAAKIRSR
jgi:DNA-binding PadR family transcriptional regulator